MATENAREEEKKMRNETNTGKRKQAARGGRSVGRPRDGFRAGDGKTNIGFVFMGLNFCHIISKRILLFKNIKQNIIIKYFVQIVANSQDESNKPN